MVRCRLLKPLSQVFQSLLQRSDRFQDLRSELATSGSIRNEKSRDTLISGTNQVKTLTDDLVGKLSAFKELSRIPARNTNSIEWSLICNSGYNIGPTTGEKVKSLCCLVMTETSNHVLACRRELLRLKTAADLRLWLWLQVNQWLGWYHSGMGGIRFSYWDRLDGEVPIMSQLYDEPKKAKVTNLLGQQLGWFGDLGDYLTSCPALCNNPGAKVAERVISSGVREAIDHLLRVGEQVYHSRDGGCDRPPAFQVSQAEMDRQRFLICPPDWEPEEGEVNPFAKMAGYRYSQRTFKVFTDDEVRTRAGKEALPEEGEQEFKGKQEGGGIYLDPREYGGDDGFLDPQRYEGDDEGDDEPLDPQSCEGDEGVHSRRYGDRRGWVEETNEAEMRHHRDQTGDISSPAPARSQSQHSGLPQTRSPSQSRGDGRNPPRNHVGGGGRSPSRNRSRGPRDFSRQPAPKLPANSGGKKKVPPAGVPNIQSFFPPLRPAQARNAHPPPVDSSRLEERVPEQSRSLRRPESEANATPRTSLSRELEASKPQVVPVMGGGKLKRARAGSSAVQKGES